MKRTFLFLATFAAVAVGCSKNAIVDAPDVAYNASTINFAPSTGLSKANDNGLAELQNVDGFEVFGIKSDGAMLFGKPTGAKENNYKYVLADTKWSWGLTTDKQWPVDVAQYPLTFLAMHPAQNFSANYPTVVNWTKEITQGATTEATVDYLSAMTVQPAAPMSGQLSSLLFKHIMSNIKFNVMIPDGYKVYVTRAIYHNLHNKNTYNFLTQKWEPVAPVAAGVTKYEYGTGAMQTLVGAGAALPIATTGDVTIKALPQNFATSWDIAAFISAGAAWTAAGGTDTWPTAAATAALATGTYVELQYALVDANGVCVVGKINGQKITSADGSAVEYTGDDQFLRVAYKVDLTKADGALEPAKRYTYQIALGTANATGGTVLDPTFVKQDGTTPGDDNGKEPGDDVNANATEIGFSISVEDWTDGTASFEPRP